MKTVETQRKSRSPDIRGYKTGGENEKKKKNEQQKGNLA